MPTRRRWARKRRRKAAAALAGVTLILLSTEREGFYAAAGCRRRLEEMLRAQGWLGELGAAVRGGAGYGPTRPGAPELRHFLYKPLEGPEEMQQLPQFTRCGAGGTPKWGEVGACHLSCT